MGGTFDPPHKGHLYISKIAIKKIKLKKILWVVTKKNPLKRKPYLKIKECFSTSCQNCVTNTIELGGNDTVNNCLLTGPIGSGKSTTNASLIETINQTRSEYIITIEKPIEYVFTNNNRIILGWIALLAVPDT